MIKYLLPSLLLFSLHIYAQAVGILFDNSGSMRQLFSSQALQDGKRLVLDLAFEGAFDSSAWKVESINPKFRSAFESNRALWNTGDMLYLHAFGELKHQLMPFFRQSPHHRQFTNNSEAKSFVKNQLFSRLNYSDNHTHFHMADLVAWKIIGEELPRKGQKTYCYLLTVSDFLADPNVNIESIEQDLENERTASETTTETYLILTHKGPSKGNRPLKLTLSRLEWINISKSKGLRGSSSPSGSAELKLIRPPQNYQFELNERLKQIRFTWTKVEGAHNYKIHIRQIKPAVQIGSFTTRAPVYNLNTRRISSLRKLDKVDFIWYVEAILGDQAKLVSKEKRKFSIKTESSCGVLCILLIIGAAGVLLFVLFKFGDHIKDFINNLLGRSRKETSKRSKPPNGAPPEENGIADI